MSDKERARETETDRRRERQTGRDRDKDRDRHTDTQRQTDQRTEIQVDKKETTKDTSTKLSQTARWVSLPCKLGSSFPLTAHHFDGACLLVCLLVGCLTSQQHASVSQGRICSDSCTCCHTETEVADPTFHLTQSQYTDTGPTSPSADPITPGA